MQETPVENQTPAETPEVSPPRYGSISPVRRGGQGKKFVLILVVLLLLGALIGGVVLIGGRQEKQEENIPTPTPTETPTPTPPPAVGSPTPTSKPTPTEKLSPTPTKKPTKAITIKVLNGGGVTGAAKQASDYLSGLGYEIVGVGNAETQDFETTTIQIKQTKQSSLDQLKIDLQTKYSLGTSSATLSATDSADAVVTVGKK